MPTSVLYIQSPTISVLTIVVWMLAIMNKCFKVLYEIVNSYSKIGKCSNNTIKSLGMTIVPIKTII